MKHVFLALLLTTAVSTSSLPVAYERTWAAQKVVHLTNCTDPSTRITVTDDTCFKALDNGSYTVACGVGNKAYYIRHEDTHFCRTVGSRSNADTLSLCNQDNKFGFRGVCGDPMHFDGVVRLRVRGCNGSSLPMRTLEGDPCVKRKQKYNGPIGENYKTRNIRCDRQGFYYVTYEDSNCREDRGRTAAVPLGDPTTKGGVQGYETCGYFGPQLQVFPECQIPGNSKQERRILKGSSSPRSASRTLLGFETDDLVFGPLTSRKHSALPSVDTGGITFHKESRRVRNEVILNEEWRHMRE